MAILAKGVSKKVAYKKETNWGELAGDTGAKEIRRVTSSFNVEVETLQSAEIRTDYQIADYRHGTRSATGSIEGELSPATYSDFFAAALAKNFVAGGTTTGASVTIAVSGDLYTITRAAGSWLTDGYYVGNIVRMSGAGLNVGNVANNCLILSMTALVLTVNTLGDNVLVAEGPIAATDIAVVGKQTYAPLTGHTSDSFTFEEFYSDISPNQSEVYTGNKVGSVAVQLPTSGFVTTSINFMGKDLEQTGTTRYFTSPTAANTEGLTVAVSGAVIVNGVPAAVITSASFNIDRALEPAQVIGTNHAVQIFDGRINVTGDFSTYFLDGTFRDYFLNEDRISLVLALSTGSEKNAEVITFVMPVVKLGSSTRGDGETGLVQDHSFQALLNTDTASGLIGSTMLIQDTAVA